LILFFCSVASAKNVSAKRSWVSQLIYVLFLATAAINLKQNKQESSAYTKMENIQLLISNKWRQQTQKSLKGIPQIAKQINFTLKKLYTNGI